MPSSQADFAESLDTIKTPGGNGPTTVSTLAEADYFAAGGFTDIPYAVGLGLEKIRRTRELVARGIDLSVRPIAAIRAENFATPGEPEGAADVVVVGAGFTGLSAALALAKKGAKVVVLEADRVAGAASGRNGGMCNNGFAQDYSALSSKLGRERANMLYRAFDAGVDKVESIIAEEGIDCHFGRVGKLKFAAKPEHSIHGGISPGRPFWAISANPGFYRSSVLTIVFRIS